MIENISLANRPFVLFLAAFVVTFVVISCLRVVAEKIGLVDYPGGRKKHKNTVPLIGGIAIFIGASLLLWHIFAYDKAYVVYWCVCCGLVGISIIDDKFMLPPGCRFFVQFLLIIILGVYGGTTLSSLGNLLGFGIISLGNGAVLFTAFAAVGITNAVNMMDGVDGLTGCVSLSELSLLLFIALSCGAHGEAVIIITLMGAITAFLFFNFPASHLERRKIFLGDAGSMLIGMTLAWLCMRLTQSPHYYYPPALMLWIVALPLMDTLHLMINRKARGISPFKADRRHIHHILLQLGYSPRQVTVMLAMLAWIVGAFGMALYSLGLPEECMFWAMIVVFALYSLLAYSLKKRAARRKYGLF